MTVAEAAAPSPARPRATDQGLLTVGIDVGGTKVACVVTDGQDRMLLHEVEPTDPTRLAAQLAELVRRAMDHFAADPAGHVAAVGVAIPGFVDPVTGEVGLAVNLGGESMALGPLLQQSLGLPCYVEHDARAAAHWLRDATDPSRNSDLVYLSVGTGVSAGIVLDGRVLRGANGLAGEIGHTFADAARGRCACGLVGCVEMSIAGPAIGRLARGAASAAAETTLTTKAGAADVFHAAESGDKVALEVIDDVAARLATLVRGLVLTLGVNRVVIGGGVAAAGDALLVPLLAAIERESASSALVAAAFGAASVELLSPQVEAGARGAAAIARSRLSADRKGVGD